MGRSSAGGASPGDRGRRTAALDPFSGTLELGGQWKLEGGAAVRMVMVYRCTLYR